MMQLKSGNTYTGDNGIDAGLTQIFLICTCLGIGEQPMAVMFGKLEIELQTPCMTPSSKDGSIDSATTSQGGMIAINLDVHLLMLG